MNLVMVDATRALPAALAGVADPESKRRIIGDEFIRVFEEEASQTRPDRLPDPGHAVSRRHRVPAPETKAAQKIKTHHNVGGLPADLRFQLIEPLRYLFKDEVRAVGLELGLPEQMVHRQPFPGPGLAIRIIGEVTEERLDILREADWIVIDEIKAAGLYRSAVAVVRDPHARPLRRRHGRWSDLRQRRRRSCRYQSEDGMTADWAKLPYDVLAKISSRIVNEVPGVNRVVYDISSKPPATIEWE